MPKRRLSTLIFALEGMGANPQWSAWKVLHTSGRLCLSSVTAAMAALGVITVVLVGSLAGWAQEEGNTLFVETRLHSWRVGFALSSSEIEDREKPLDDVRLVSEDCDLSRGTWVYDETYPLYNTTRCPFVEQGYLCHKNGRPDLSYLKLRWQPHGCLLPRFNAQDFLERMRNERVVFVGDSLSRNQFESLLCMISEGMVDPSTMYEVNGSPITKHIGSLVFKIPEYNLSVEYYRSPYLVIQGTASKGNGNRKVSRLAIRVDEPDFRWAYDAKGAGILIFNAGHWWNDHKVFGKGFHFQRNSRVNMSMTVEEAFPLSLQTVRKWCENNVDFNRSRVFFRGLGPAHFRKGDWERGGTCDQFTSPIPDSDLPQHDFGPLPDNLEAKTVFAGSSIEFLDVSRLTMNRADSHIAQYWTPNATLRNATLQDCSHWCLPGVPDTWNELMYAQLLREKRIYWDDASSSFR